MEARPEALEETASSAITTVHTKVAGSFSSVSAVNSTRTSDVIAIATPITTAFEPVSRRSRSAATPSIRKITIATTLPIWAMAVRSNALASTSTPAAEITSPFGPPSARPPKSGGNICSFASSAVMLPAANRFALTDDEVASSAAIDIS